MKLHIIDSVGPSNKRYELAQDESNNFIVIKVTSGRISRLYSSINFESAMSFYERTIGAL